VKIILVVNDSPWGSTLSATAERIARAMVDAGHRLEAVFFREEGVYNAVASMAGHGEAADLAQCWAKLAEQAGTDLMVCQSSSTRRLDSPPAAPFREAGLVEFIDRLAACDRALTF
jgi:tRNA 2-thiouridine synthesizing protein D